MAELALPPNVTPARSKARVTLLSHYENEFVRTHPGIGPLSHQTAYLRVSTDAQERQVHLTWTKSLPHLRDAYGRNQFGQGCLLARLGRARRSFRGGYHGRPTWAPGLGHPL